MTYDFVKELLEMAQKFEQESPAEQPKDLQHFSDWLSRKQLIIPFVPTENQSIFSEKAGEVPKPIGSEIVRLLTNMYRYARTYSKIGLESSPFLTYDDFTYLIYLQFMGSMTKIQLIELNIHEKPTGMEIIKRLINNELLTQRDDENDRRSKQISVTPKGSAMLFATFETMQKVSNIVTGDLTNQEQFYLQYLLERLDKYHNPVFLNKIKTLEGL